MIRLIVGNKGSGKTKTLIELANQAAVSSKGNVVCIEKDLKLTYDLNYKVRLISIADYGISGCDAFLGFLAGVLAGNYDITDIFVDGTLKVAGRNYADLDGLIEKFSGLCEKNGINAVFTVSCDISELPEGLKKYIL